MNIKIVSIDLDGTLVDTLSIHRDAFIKAVKEVYNYDLTKEYHDKYLLGLTSRAKMDRLIAYSEISGNKNLIDHIIILKNKFSKEMINIKPNIELNNILYRLADKVIFTCVTNTSKDFAHQILMTVHLKELFDYIITGDDVEYHKPHPDPYLKLRDCFPLHYNEEFLIIEDSQEGIKSARDAGYKNIWVVKDPSDLLKIESQI